MRKVGNGRISLTMSVTFLVVTDNKNTTREEVLLTTVNAPIVNLPYGPLNATCISKDVERIETNPLYWEMTCEFDTASDDQKPDPQDPTNPDPTTWISIWKINVSSDNEKTIWKDFSTTPAAIANTAGELYDPLPTIKQSLCSFRFTQYEPASLTLKQIADRNHKVNETVFNGFDDLSLLLHVKDADLGVYNGVYCWKIDYEVTYNPQSWLTEMYSWGWNFIDGGGKLVPYKIDNTLVFGPLNSTGGKAADPDSAFKQEFLLIEKLEFSTFIRV